MKTTTLKPSLWRKQEPLEEALLAMAMELGAGSKMPPVRTICTDFGVSTSTLDPVLRRLELRGTILREHGRGVFVTDRVDHKTIGVVFGGDIFSPSFSPFWSLLLQAARELTADGPFVPRAYLDIAEGGGGLGSHAQLIEDLETRRLDGVLLFAPAPDHDQFDELGSCGVPLVCFGDGKDGNWSVAIDWEPLLMQAGAELARLGCRHVGLLAPPAHRAVLEEAFREAGAEGVRIDDWSYETWANVIPGAGSRENCAHRLTGRMIAEQATNPLPEALISLGDTATRGAITALLQTGFQSGRDIRIVTAENKGSPVLDPYAADITRIAIDPRECMQAALGMLETLMAGGTPEVNPVRVKAGSGESDQ
jgi:DNA-binding LacI/PurR family transcriptional regulator